MGLTCNAGLHELMHAALSTSQTRLAMPLVLIEWTTDHALARAPHVVDAAALSCSAIW